MVLQEIFQSQKSHLGLLNRQEDLYHGATGEAHAADDHLLKPTQVTVPSVSLMEAMEAGSSSCIHVGSSVDKMYTSGGEC